MQEEVGEEVERSLGSTYEVFSGFQGTISHVLETGLNDDMLREVGVGEWVPPLGAVDCNGHLWEVGAAAEYS